MNKLAEQQRIVRLNFQYSLPGMHTRYFSILSEDYRGFDIFVEFHSMSIPLGMEIAYKPHSLSHSYIYRHKHLPTKFQVDVCRLFGEDSS